MKSIRISISLPKNLHDLMQEKLKTANWSAIARRAFENALDIEANRESIEDRLAAIENLLKDKKSL